MRDATFSYNSVGQWATRTIPMVTGSLPINSFFIKVVDCGLESSF